MTKRLSLAEAVARPEMDQDRAPPSLAYDPTKPVRRKGILVRVDQETHRRLMIVAAQRSTKLQTLLASAIDQILAEGERLRRPAVSLASEAVCDLPGLLVLSD